MKTTSTCNEMKDTFYLTQVSSSKSLSSMGPSSVIHRRPSFYSPYCSHGQVGTSSSRAGLSWCSRGMPEPSNQDHLHSPHKIIKERKKVWKRVMRLDQLSDIQKMDQEYVSILGMHHPHPHWPSSSLIPAPALASTSRFFTSFTILSLLLQSSCHAHTSQPESTLASSSSPCLQRTIFFPTDLYLTWTLFLHSSLELLLWPQFLSANS